MSQAEPELPHNSGEVGGGRRERERERKREREKKKKLGIITCEAGRWRSQRGVGRRYDAGAGDMTCKTRKGAVEHRLE